MESIGIINTKEYTKKELLEQYFLNNERKLKIGRGELLSKEEHINKIIEQNLCINNCYSIAKAMHS